MEDPQRLFHINDGSKASSYWRKKNTALVLQQDEQIVCSRSENQSCDITQVYKVAFVNKHTGHAKN